MIWGLTLPPGQPYSVTVDEEVQLSMVALESRGNYGAYSQIPVQITVNTGKAEYLLCTLVHGQLYQQIVDIKLLPKEKVVFCAHGSGLVHVTGYTKQFSQDDMFDNSYQEEEEEEEEPPEDDPGPEITVDEGWQPMTIEDTREMVPQQDVGPPPPKVSRVQPTRQAPEDSTTGPPRPEIIAGGQGPDILPQETYPSGHDQTQNLPPDALPNTSKSSYGEVDIKEEDDFVQIVLPGPDSDLSSPHHQHHAGSAITSPASTPTRQTTPAMPSTSSPLPVRLHHGGQSEPSTSAGSYTYQDQSRYSYDVRLQSAQEVRGRAPPPIRSAAKNQTFKPFECKRCRRDFARQEDLTTHELTADHTIRKHICVECQRGFPNKSGLDIHSRTHTNIRPYKCSMCPQAFAQAGTLGRHEQTHLKYIKLDCKFCKTRFRYEADCQRHMRLCKKGPGGSGMDQ